MDDFDFPNGPPQGGAFAGGFRGGQMPADLKEMAGLMKWKKERQSDTRVQSFDKTNGDLQHPTPGSPPNAALMEKMKKYIDDLKVLKNTIDSTAQVHQAAKPATKIKSKILPDCSDSRSVDELRGQIKDLQIQITQMNSKFDAAVAVSDHSQFVDGKMFPKDMRPPGSPGTLASVDQDPETKARMQKRLLAQQVSKLREQTQDFKDQAEDFNDKICTPPGNDRGFGGPPDIRMGDDDSGAKNFPDRPPLGSSNVSGMPGGKDMDLNALTLDLPDDLQGQLNGANRGLAQAKSRLRTAKNSWQKKCQEEAQSRPPMGGGGMGMNQMQMMGGGTSSFGGMGSMGFGNSQPAIGLATINAFMGSNFMGSGLSGMSSMGGAMTGFGGSGTMGMSGSYGYGMSQGGYSSSSPMISSNYYYNPYASSVRSGYGYSSSVYSLYGSYGSGSYNYGSSLYRGSPNIRMF